MPTGLPAPCYQTVFLMPFYLDPLPPTFAIITGFNPMDEAHPHRSVLGTGL